MSTLFVRASGGLPAAVCSPAAQSGQRIGVALVAALLALAGCSIAPVSPTSVREPTRVVQPRESFDLGGRLSVARSRDGFSGSFRWIADRGRDRIELATPTGQTLAVLTSGDGAVNFTAADGRTDQADSWEALTERELGWPLPVSGLRYWIQGTPRPGVAFSREADEQGRVASMRQDGWEIVYRYADGTESPSGMRLLFQDLELRLALDRRG